MGRYVESALEFFQFSYAWLCTSDYPTCIAPIAASGVFGSKPCDNTMMDSYNKVGASVIGSIPSEIKSKIESKIALDLTLYKEANGLFSKRLDHCK